MSNKQLVFVVIITFIVIVIWIIADILHTKPSVEVNPKMTTLLTPITPTFDQKVISQIKEVTPVGNLEVDTAIKPITTTPVSTTSALPVVQPNATPLPFPTEIIASISAIPGGTE